MTKDDLMRGLADVREKLAEFETEARKLQNQNLADIAASAKGKMQQLCEHPDLELVGADRDNTVRQAEMPFDPKAGEVSRATPPGSDFPGQQPAFGPTAGSQGGPRPPFDPNVPTTREEAVERMRVSRATDPEGSARMNWPHLFAAPGGAPVQTGHDESKTYRPGDPQFTERANVDFRDPHNVDLNKDGTLQVAPNTKGASDVRG